MKKVWEESVLNCENCPEAIHVISSDDDWYECQAIQRMGVEDKPNCHPVRQILVYGGKFYIPGICPMPMTEKIGEIYPKRRKL